MFRDALLVAGKDLRIEMKSKVATNQVLPFSFLVLVMFAFALDADRGLLSGVAAGLFWVTVLFSGLLAIARSFAIEAGDDARDALRLSGLDGAGIFLGKAGAVAVQLLALEVVLAVGAVVLYDVSLRGAGLLVVTCLLATGGIAAAGTIYGAVAAGLRVRETLLPLLLLPVLAPVLLAAARASEAALDVTTADGWPWVRLLAVFTAAYVAFGVVAFGPLLEES
ncbi:MAG: heme exporter protein CcmB [Actinomycetota bacterium]|jgi:heme exporter protein B